MRISSSRLVTLAAFFAAGSALAQPAPSPAAAAKPAAPPLRAVATDGAPKAAGPYSQAIVEGGFLFTAGQVSRDPKTNTVLTGPIEQAVDRVFDNLEAILKAEGLGWADVVRTTVYMTKSEDFAAMNAVYAKRMGDGRPARTTVFVAGLPGGAPIEMDLIARVRR
jgi:2-iminobutanoate/2-iminopropanoate deaminase